MARRARARPPRTGKSFHHQMGTPNRPLGLSKSPSGPTMTRAVAATRSRTGHPKVCACRSLPLVPFIRAASVGRARKLSSSCSSLLTRALLFDPQLSVQRLQTGRCLRLDSQRQPIRPLPQQRLRRPNRSRAGQNGRPTTTTRKRRRRQGAFLGERRQQWLTLRASSLPQRQARVASTRNPDGPSTVMMRRKMGQRRQIRHLQSRRLAI